MTATAPKPKVLIVDDTPVNLRAMRGMLSKLDCELVEARSGAEALAKAAADDFALVLLDVQMPEMDGFEVATRLTEDAQTRDVPIIFVTAAFSDDLYRMHGYKVGAVDYIAKPFDSFVLMSKVQAFLELYRSRSALKQALDTLHLRNEQLEKEIGERRRAEELVQHRATHDPLTELPNRMLFMDRLHTGIERARRERRTMALLYMDIDRFKPVNDEHGHHAGDELLKAIARRSLEALRKTDTVARLGGDEFAVLLENLSSPDEAQQLADKLRALLAAPFTLQPGPGQPGIEVTVGASVGIAVFPRDADDEEGLLRFADAQMYRQKRTR